MEFFESLNENDYVGCQCDDYCSDSPSCDSGCDDGNEGWHTGEDPQ
jgi:hypothetical protein